MNKSSRTIPESSEQSRNHEQRIGQVTELDTLSGEEVLGERGMGLPIYDP